MSRRAAARAATCPKLGMSDAWQKAARPRARRRGCSGRTSRTRRQRG